MTVLPPPETTPSLTVRLATGTPRFVEASPSSACLAVAAAARSGGPALDWMPVLPPVAPEFTTCQLSQALWRTWLTEHVELLGDEHQEAGRDAVADLDLARLEDRRCCRR